MATERTPEEITEGEDAYARVQKVIDQAIEDYASWVEAERLDLDPESCEQWVNRIWNGVRDNLDDEDRVVAIVHLITDAANQRADQIRRSLEVR